MRWLLVLVGVLSASRVNAAPCEVPSPAGVSVKVDGLRATMRWANRATRVVEAASCAELVDAVALIAEIAAATNKAAKPARAPRRQVVEAPTPSSDEPAPAEPTPRASPDEPATDEPTAVEPAPVDADAAPPADDDATDRGTAPLVQRATTIPVARVERAPDAPIASLADGISASLGGATAHGSHGWQSSLDLGARARRGAYSLELQLAATLPASEALMVGRVEVRSLAASVAPCVHLGPFAACALASAGAVVGEGIDLAATRRAVTPLFALGGRLAMETALSDRFALRLRADVLGNLAASRFDVDGMTVWATDRFGAWFGADAILRFP